MPNVASIPTSASGETSNETLREAALTMIGSEH